MSDISYDKRNSVYCYKNTNILINKLDILDIEKLNKYERDITQYKLAILEDEGIIGNFDIKHFLNIHKFLFDEIYPFAGETRVENISKDNFEFADYKYIDEELSRLLKNLKKQEFLHKMDKADLAYGIANLMADLNVLHPFREGNGRTIREFARELALENNYYLNYGKMNKDELLKAQVKSVMDTYDLAKLIWENLDPVPEEEKIKQIPHQEEGKEEDFS